VSESQTKFDQDYIICNSGGIYPLITCLSGHMLQEVPHEKKDATLITIFIFFIMEEFQLLVTKD
jgi:hypothetical protein